MMNRKKINFQRRAKPGLKIDEPLKHPDHRRPLSRREFISQGFATGAATIMSGSLLNGFLSSKANAALSPDLEALKALLPEYEGKIKCIYIDPPYNTGNEGPSPGDLADGRRAPHPGEGGHQDRHRPDRERLLECAA